MRLELMFTIPTDCRFHSDNFVIYQKDNVDRSIGVPSPDSGIFDPIIPFTHCTYDSHVKNASSFDSYCARLFRKPKAFTTTRRSIVISPVGVQKLHTLNSIGQTNIIRLFSSINRLSTLSNAQIPVWSGSIVFEHTIMCVLSYPTHNTHPSPIALAHD